jgi:importin subunit alpha-1
VLRNATWTLSNFCRGKPQSPFDLIRPALNTLAQLIYSTDDAILTDACWALSYLSDGPNDKIQAVIESGVGLISCCFCGKLLNYSLQRLLEDWLNC